MVKGIINYIFLLLLAIGGLLFYHNYALFILLIIIALFPLYSGIGTYILAGKMKISFDIEQKSVARGHSINLKIIVDNPTWCSSENVIVKFKIYNYFYGNDEVITISVPATAGEVRTLEWNFNSKYCGRIIVSAINASVKDITGMFSFSARLNDAQAEVIVMPEIRKIENKLELTSEGDGEEPTVQYRKGNDVSEISEIREYIPGDKMQMVHWKMTAKQDKIMVKEYSMPYTNEFLLVPELYYDGNNPEILDDIMDRLYSYADIFRNEGRIFYIGWFNAATGEFFYERIESETDVTMTVRQIFYSKLWKIPYQTRDFFQGKGRYEGKMVVYIGNSVIQCIS